MNNIDSINDRIIKLKQLGENVKKISDGNHTFEELYLQRMLSMSPQSFQRHHKKHQSSIHI